MKRLLFLLLAALSMAGCSLYGSDAPGEGDLEYTDLEYTDLDIRFRIAEAHSGPEGEPEKGEPPSLFLFMKSDTTLPCSNFRLVNRFDREGSVVDVRILGAELPGEYGLCLTALGPATAQRDFDLAPGTYRLRFAFGDVTDEYAIEVGEEAVRIETIRAERSAPEDSLFWRYPERSFAFYCGTRVEDQDLCAAFAARLEENLDLTPIEAPVAGTWPYGLTSGGHWYDAPARFYEYEAEADFERAGALLRDFTETVLAGIEGDSFSLVNWRGETFYSYLMK